MLTYDEQERIAYANGTPSLLLAELADREHMEDNVSNTISYIEESRGSMPGEDFLADPIKALQVMSAKLRAELMRVIETLEDIQSTQAHSTEYGLEQLTKALTELGA